MSPAGAAGIPGRCGKLWIANAGLSDFRKCSIANYETFRSEKACRQTPCHRGNRTRTMAENLSDDAAEDPHWCRQRNPAAPVPPSNRPFRHTCNPLFSNAFCVCQIDTVLHYFLRTESRTESKRDGSRQICGAPRTSWHTQKRPEPRVAWGKPRNNKAN